MNRRQYVTIAVFLHENAKIIVTVLKNKGVSNICYFTRHFTFD